MSFLGNVLWFLFVGWWSALSWIFFGVLWSITIIGLPIGTQCFKMASLSAAPFNKNIVSSDSSFSLIINIIWIFIGGLELASTYLCAALICYITIIGIPFGNQCIKLAKLSLVPFGSDIIER